MLSNMQFYNKITIASNNKNYHTKICWEIICNYSIIYFGLQILPKNTIL